MKTLTNFIICFSLAGGVVNPVRSSERWVKYASDSVSENFIDANSIRRFNGVTSYVGLLNFINPVTPTASVISLHEVRCSEKDIRLLEFTTFSEFFGNGRKIGKIQPSSLGMKNDKFYPIDKYSNSQYNFICSTN